MARDILITGVTGLIGRSVARRLRMQDYNLLGVSRQGSMEPIPTLSHDMGKDPFEDFIYKMEPFSPDTLIHLGAYIPQPGEEMDCEEAEKVNAVFSKKLFNFAKQKGIRRIIYSSSTAVLRKPLETPVTENHPTGAAECYGASKLRAEKSLLDLGESVSPVIFRISSPVALTLTEMPHSVVRTWIETAAAGKNIEVHGTGNRAQDFVHVSDLSQALAKAVESGEEGIFNLSSGSNLSMIELAETIAHSFAVEVIHKKETPSNEDIWNISIEKTRKAFDYVPRFSATKAIEQLINQSRETRDTQ